MAEASAGKDSVTGHWELSGVVLSRPFPTYPHGFPPEVIAAFERSVGREVLGNVAASGTEILETFGPEHLATGKPIVYTSADSVFQVAAHVDVVAPAVLVEWCRRARGLLRGEHEVGRVIARPFTGRPGTFVRTPDRKDFAVVPPGVTILDAAAVAGVPTTAIGKVSDLFSGRGVGRSVPAKGNEACLAALGAVVEEGGPGLVFANLVDFDTLYGHRNDPEGYADALRSFDDALSRLLRGLAPEDVLVVTADHGNDPTTPSTDHSRELVPVLVTGRRVAPGRDLGLRRTFADVAATVAELLALDLPTVGTSFAPDLCRDR
jgi:phosphopentomutase